MRQISLQETGAERGATCLFPIAARDFYVLVPKELKLLKVGTHLNSFSASHQDVYGHSVENDHHKNGNDNVETQN